MRAGFNPDREIVNSTLVAVTSDSNVLDGVARWLNLARLVIEGRISDPWLVDLNVQ